MADHDTHGESKVFISYSRKDRQLVSALAAHLASEGIEVLWDKDILGGEDYKDRLANWIENADMVVVLLTEHSVSSRWVADEVSLARECECHRLPLNIGNVELSRGMRLDLIRDNHQHFPVPADARVLANSIIRTLNGLDSSRSRRERSVETSATEPPRNRDLRHAVRLTTRMMLVAGISYGAWVAVEEFGPQLSSAGEQLIKDVDGARDPIKLIEASSRPELPGPLGGLRFGMSKSEIREVMEGAALYDFSEAKFFWSTSKTSGELMSATFQIKGSDMSSLLTEAWGDPKRGVEMGNPKLFWFNERKRLRASVLASAYSGDRVEFDEYLPVRSLFGESEELLGFEDAERPLLGATLKEVIVHYSPVKINEPTASGDDVLTYIELPPTEYDRSNTRVLLDFDRNGKVDKLRILVEWGQLPSAKEELVDVLVEKWGSPKERRRGGGHLLVFRRHPTVTLRESSAQQDLWVVEIA